MGFKQRTSWISIRYHLEFIVNINILLIVGLLLKSLISVLVVVTSIIRLLLNPEIIYYFAYGALGILATFIHPFFFSFHLTEFLMRYPTLRRILKSIYEPRKMLLLTLILILLALYFFTVFGYWVFNDSYDGRCDNVYMCFFESFDKNFKAVGGLGGWLNLIKRNTASKQLSINVLIELFL